MKNTNWKKIIIIVVVVLLCLTVVKDFLIKTTITTVGSAVLGAPIKIGYFSLGLFTQGVAINNLKVYNPPGFPKEIMINAPQIRVKYDLWKLFQGKIRLPLIVFNLKEMIVIKNKEGKLNVDALKVVEEQKSKTEKKKEGSKPAKEMALEIDLLKLNVERVVLKDFTKGEPFGVYSYEIALKNKEFRNIKSVEQMATLIMVQAMGPTAIQGAGVYAAATVLGVGFLPAGIVGALVAKDSETAEFSASVGKTYEIALNLIKKMGEVKSEDKTTGIVKGKVDVADVTVKVEKNEKRKTQVTVSARQLVLPKPEIAAGIIYQLKQKIR
ncbi:MAG: hypothetical protein WC676_04980 [Candidatus Omnitrophota bacterium]